MAPTAKITQPTADNIQHSSHNPGPAECAVAIESAAPRMGVHGVLDCTNGVAEVVEAQPADEQEAEEESADPLITPP